MLRVRCHEVRYHKNVHDLRSFIFKLLELRSLFKAPGNCLLIGADVTALVIIFAILLKYAIECFKYVKMV